MKCCWAVVVAVLLTGSPARPQMGITADTRCSALHGLKPMQPLQALLEEVSRDHFPYPPASPEELDAFEQRVGWQLDPDLRAFYLHCNGAELFERLPECPYRILPLSKIVRARRGPASMYALCDLQDGDYIFVDVSRQENGRYPLIDGWHEAWPDPKHCKPIARSFSEFLERALRSEGFQFWLKQDKT